MVVDRTSAPRIRPIEQFSILRPERRDMPNGMPLYVIRAGSEDVVRFDLLVRSGQLHQRLPLQAMFTNRMLREGTRQYTAACIAEKLDYYGAWLDLSSAPEYTYVTLYSLNKYLPQTLDILESLVKEPVFPEKELKVIVDTNVEQFKVNLSKVDFLAHRALVKTLFGGHHPAGRLVCEDDYQRIVPDVLRQFYDRYYNSGNCTLYLSGKITGDCVRRVEALFGNEPFGQGTRPEKKTFRPETDARKQVFVERSGVLQSAVRLGMLTLDRCHPDYLKFRVLVTLLGGYFGSRLMSNIREQKGYTYGISAGYASYPDQGVLTISTETANQYVAPLIVEVYREITRLQDEQVSSEELSMVKNYMLGDLCRSCESAFSLADGWIFLQVYGLKDTYFADAMQAIKDITPGEIQDLACKYLRKEDLKEVVAGAK